MVCVEVEVVVLLRVGAVGCEGEVEVELDVVVVDDELEEEEVVVVVVIVVLVEDELVAGVVQVIVSETTPERWRSGMTPGVASTGIVFTAPPISVTVTAHGSAEATGTAATATRTSQAAAVPSTARTLRLIVKLARPLLPPLRCASHASDSVHSVCGKSRY